MERQVIVDAYIHIRACVYTEEKDIYDIVKEDVLPDGWEGELEGVNGTVIELEED